MVIGGGAGGLVTAAGAARVGARVAIIESHLLGGDCLNVGCVPSKALIRCAKAVAQVRKASDFGVDVAGFTVDFPRMMERLRRLRAKVSKHDGAERFARAGVDVFIGRATFTGPDAVEVNGQTLRFHKAVVASGAAPFVPPVPGLREATLGPDPKGLLEEHDLPGHLVGLVEPREALRAQLLVLGARPRHAGQLGEQ